MPTAIVTVSFDIENDKDLLRWLAKQSNRSAAIRDALRSHMTRASGPTLADVLAEVRALPSKMAVVACAPPPEGEGQEPGTAAANLNGLLGRLEDGDLG